MNLKSLFLAASLVSIAPFAQAEDQTNFKFDEGSVLIHCAAPTSEDMISTEVFNAGFPTWITDLQRHANDGKIARAHYLGELKEGIFIVAIGKDKDEAKANAEAILKANTETMRAALKAAGVEADAEVKSACQLIEIGPVAVLPQ